MSNYIPPKIDEDAGTPTPYFCNAAAVGVGILAIAIVDIVMAVTWVLVANLVEGVLAIANYQGVGGTCNT
ncbi:hypothetical protein [uncultured Faecalicoccus sp.]|uniref:hypothetical protein n=1 Tax=uncultured Faecalicoccus sp. TaxID=1971760 RepID=UPI002590F262|nr:hypothetical protein [uncultured Faecalicoccus sp.]